MVEYARRLRFESSSLSCREWRIEKRERGEGGESENERERRERERKRKG